MTNDNRVPAGSPEGGQFAAGANAESSAVTLPTDSKDVESLEVLANADPEFDYRKPLESIMIPGDVNSGWAASCEHRSAEDSLALLHEYQARSDGNPLVEHQADVSLFYGGPDAERPPAEVRKAALDMVYRDYPDPEHRKETERLMDLTNRMEYGPDADHALDGEDDLRERAEEIGMERHGWTPAHGPSDPPDAWDGAHWGMHEIINDRMTEVVDTQRFRRVRARRS